MVRIRIFVLLLLAIFAGAGLCWAEKENFKLVETGSPEKATTASNSGLPTAVSPPTPAGSAQGQTSFPAEAEQEQQMPQQVPLLVKAEEDSTYTDPTNYTLGPEDVVDISIMRHPEFSGIFPINLEGKIQYKYVGDIEVNGLSKKQLEEKLKTALSAYLINPEVTVTIMDYKSKVIYVLGEVGTPGKYYMRSESIPVREAVVLAGLPTLSAAMRRCQIVTPDKTGKAKIKDVDLYALLYGGDLTKNLDMHPGDVLYVPATVMAKVIRVINPVTQAVGVSTAGPSNVSSAKTSFTRIAK